MHGSPLYAPVYYLHLFSFQHRIDGSHGHPFVEIDVSEGLEGDYPVAKDIALDPTQRYLYASVGPRVSFVS